jgi:hypothetical protein
VELSKEEAELLAWVLGLHWIEFSERAEDLVRVCALHRLAEKLGLNNL